LFLYFRPNDGEGSLLLVWKDEYEEDSVAYLMSLNGGRDVEATEDIVDAFKDNLGPCHRSPLIRSLEISDNSESYCIAFHVVE
jgi:hypothetical protein